MNREQWLQQFAADVLRVPGVTVLPSCPAARARGGRVCELATDEQGGTVLLVSPTLADSLEVAVVVAYLVDRLRATGPAGRLGARAARQLGAAGWRVNGWVVDPSDARAEVLASQVETFTVLHGDYPAAPVAQSARRSHARSGVLTLTCMTHSQVRAQQTRRQFADHPVNCGHCDAPLVEVSR